VWDRPKRGFRRAAFSALAASTLLTSPAWSQTEDKAGATLMYDEASKLMAAGKTEQACAKFAESQRLDPQLGTLLHLADCQQKIGRTASAWANFREAAEIAAHRSDAREKTAHARAAALEPTLSKMVIDVAPGAKSSSGLKVERDGIAVGSALWGTAVPVDPGAHSVTASADGKKKWSGTVTVAAGGQTASISVPELEPEASAGQPAAVDRRRGARGRRSRARDGRRAFRHEPQAGAHRGIRAADRRARWTRRRRPVLRLSADQRTSTSTIVS
jgi:serine/threonine-protein kinase